MDNEALTKYINELLNIDAFNDYAPNGLQVEGKSEVKKIVTGVTACEALIDAAIEQEADALIVHHGYFWKGEDPCVVGIKRNRLKKLLTHNINLFSYHLPLDAHPEFGNNIQLAHLLEFKAFGTLEVLGDASLVWVGELKQPMRAAELSSQIQAKLDRAPLHIEGDADTIQSIAWCTGAAQDFLEAVSRYGVDAYLSGEISERTVHVARESGMHYFAAGHHATEKYGVQALGRHLADTFNLEHTFIDIANPV